MSFTAGGHTGIPLPINDQLPFLDFTSLKLLCRRSELNSQEKFLNKNTCFISSQRNTNKQMLFSSITIYTVLTKIVFKQQAYKSHSTKWHLVQWRHFFIINRSWILCHTYDSNCSNILFSINDKFWYSEFKMPLNFQQASHIPDILLCMLTRRGKGGI